jgi:tRNA threonylcarbamoyladenosine biosynthesis protein TsaE
MEYLSNSNEQTLEIGQQIASTLVGGDILLMYGDLGAGKTTLTKGIAKGLGVDNDITSPTFTLMNMYPVDVGNLKQLVHIDTYRMEDAQELLDIGVQDYLGSPDTVTIIEWPEKIESLLTGKNIKKIHLEHLGEEKRNITFSNNLSP